MALVWWQPDDYHQRSSCGHYSVARRNVVGRTWYVAYRWPDTELAAVSVDAKADNETRRVAIKAMKEACDAHALTLPAPKDTVADPPEEKRA